MKFSFLREKITPDMSVMQAGFSGRTHKSEGVHDDTYASVILLQANETLVIIALDALGGDRSFASGIKQAVYEKYGLAQDKIIIGYSHTHSSVSLTGEDAEKRHPRPSNIVGDGIVTAVDEKDIDFTEDIKYYNMIKKKIMDMIEEGFKNQIEGEAYFCKGASRFGVSRRFPSEEGILWKPYFDEKSMDPDLFMIKFVDKNNNIRGLVYSYACHPTTMGPSNYLISADFPGVVRRVLEEKNKGLQAVFLQGCGADIKPCATAENGKFKGCSFDELDEAGTGLANEIQSCIECVKWRKIETQIGTGFSEMKLYTEVWGKEKWKAIADNPDENPKKRRMAAKALVRLESGSLRNYLPYYISYLRLDKQTCFVCLECEVVNDIGKELKRLFDEDIIVLGYTNSNICYIPTRKVLADGGYESESFIPARLTGPFVPEVEDIVVGRAALMVKFG